MKVSIIIPVFNASKHIERCLESLKKQTYRDLEVLFVNDSSTDDSIEKIKAFAEEHETKDLEIKVLQHVKNRGVAAARNTALDAATGDYIYSLDADDYMDADAIEQMVNEAEQIDADVVGIEWMLTFEKNGRHMSQPDVKAGEEMFKKMCRGVMRWNLWLFMIRRSVIEEHHLRFADGMNMGEDMMLMLKLSQHIKKVSIIHKPLYHYVSIDTSVSKVWSESLVTQITQNVQEVDEYVSPQYKKEIAFLKLNQKLPLLISSKQNDYDTWLSWFPEANAYILENHELPLRTKMIQYAAGKKQFWFVRFYYYLVIKFVYGIIFR